jgi:hypothetical protein
MVCWSLPSICRTEILNPGPKFDFKLAWFERLIGHAAELIKVGVPVVLAGDYNVVPTAQDFYSTRSLDNNALIQPQSRQAYARLLAQGWTDALRKLQPDGPLWTFWDYERNRWPLDKGMRLDHFLLSPTARDRLVLGGVDRWVRGEDNASDHAPAWIKGGSSKLPFGAAVLQPRALRAVSTWCEVPRWPYQRDRYGWLTPFHVGSSPEPARYPNSASTPWTDSMNSHTG